MPKLGFTSGFKNATVRALSLLVAKIGEFKSIMGWVAKVIYEL